MDNVTDELALLALDQERGTLARAGYLTNLPRSFGITTRMTSEQTSCLPQFRPRMRSSCPTISPPGQRVDARCTVAPGPDPDRGVGMSLQVEGARVDT